MFSKIFALAALASAAVAAPTDLQKRWDGQATFYYQNGNPGSCGAYMGDYDWIAALPYAANPGGNCWKSVKVQRGNNVITVAAADTCPSCAYNHIDLSVGAFQALGDQSEGVIPVSWWIEY